MHKYFQGSTTSVTIDFWMASNETSASCMLDARTSDGNAFYLDRTSGTSISVHWQGGSQVWTTPTNSDYKWHHVAFVRDTENSSTTGARSYLFFDGTECVLASGSKTHSLSGQMFSGQGHALIWGENYPSTAGYGGFMAEMRISVGIARWTSNFKVDKRFLLIEIKSLKAVNALLTSFIFTTIIVSVWQLLVSSIFTCLLET